MRTSDLRVNKEYLYTANVDYIKVKYNGHTPKGYKFIATESGVANHLSMDDVNLYIEEK
jgi:hypothetical protein